MVKDSTNGYGHNCYGFYGNHIVSGGAGGQLLIYNLSGEVVAKLVGHTSDIWSIALDGDRLVSGSSDQTIRVWDLTQVGKKRTLEPMLNLFVSNNNEWVAWSKSGYYNASVGGAKYVGFHINQGANKEALYVSADQYPALYRPDIIDATVKYGSEKRAIAKVSQRSRVQRVNVAQELPPILTLISQSNITTTKESITIRYNIESRGEIEKIVVTNNGVKVNTKRALVRVGNEKSITIPLSRGKNHIVIRAKNQYAMSQPLSVVVIKNSPSNEDIFKPTLYILGIGVKEYANSNYNLQYPDRDIKAIANLFQQQEGRLYKKVEKKLLLNQNATKDNILDALTWLEHQVTQKDVVVLFFAGHGENDANNNYYFLNYDANVERLRRTAIKWNEIRDTVNALVGKIIVMVDTCHSGNIMGSGRRGDITSAIKSITNSGRGAVIMSASTGRGYSLENNQWRHGAFTKAILDGFKNQKADYNGNHQISIKEIDLYITNRVKELTHGEQKPTTIIPDGLEDDFIIGI